MYGWTCTKTFGFSHGEAKENETTTILKKTLRIRRKHLAIAIIASPSLSPVLNDSPSLIHVGFLIYACIYVHSYVCMNMGLVSLSLDEYMCVCVFFTISR